MMPVRAQPCELYSAQNAELQESNAQLQHGNAELGSAVEQLSGLFTRFVSALPAKDGRATPQPALAPAPGLPALLPPAREQEAADRERGVEHLRALAPRGTALADDGAALSAVLHGDGVQ